MRTDLTPDEQTLLLKACWAPGMNFRQLLERAEMSLERFNEAFGGLQLKGLVTYGWKLSPEGERAAKLVVTGAREEEVEHLRVKFKPLRPPRRVRGVVLRVPMGVS